MEKRELNELMAISPVFNTIVYTYTVHTRSPVDDTTQMACMCCKLVFGFSVTLAFINF